MKNRQAWPILSGPWWSLQNLQFSRTRRKTQCKSRDTVWIQSRKKCTVWWTDEPTPPLNCYPLRPSPPAYDDQEEHLGDVGAVGCPLPNKYPLKKNWLCIGSIHFRVPHFDVIWCYLMLFDVIWCYLMLMLGDGVLPKQQPMSGEVLEDYGWVPVRLWLVGVPRL